MENEELQNLINSAKQKYSELETEFSKFSELRQELQNKAQGVRNFYGNAQTKQSQIETTVTIIERIRGEIEESKNKISTIRSEIEGYYNSFVELKNKLDDEEDGLEVNFNWVKDKKEQADQKYDEVVKILTKIEDAEEKSAELHGEIVSLKDKSQDRFDEIGKYLELVSETSRSSAFEKRKSQIQREVSIWFIVSLVGFFGLALFIYLIFLKADGNLVQSLNKVAYTTPILLLLAWSTRNYSSARLYLEKYAYKSIYSIELSTYVKLIEDKYAKDDKKVKNFIFRSLEKIFDEPFKDKEYKRLFNLFGKITYEDSERPSSKKEQDDIVVDDE
mgnify:CR=1 FL=1